jgi:hypothetical protein
LGKLDFHSVEAIVLLSPHGQTTGVYGRVTGSLDAFGVRGLKVDRRGDDRLTRALSETWGQPVLDETADHGIAVPLLHGFLPDVPVIAAAIAESSPDPAAEGKAFADVLKAATQDLTVGVVVSAHLSPSLTERAPVYVPGDRRADVIEATERTLAVLHSDAGDHASGMAAADAMGSCSLGCWSAFFSLGLRGAAEILSREEPVGVGYVVATWHASAS